MTPMDILFLTILFHILGGTATIYGWLKTGKFKDAVNNKIKFEGTNIKPADMIIGAIFIWEFIVPCMLICNIYDKINKFFENKMKDEE